MNEHLEPVFKFWLPELEEAPTHETMQ